MYKRIIRKIINILEGSIREGASKPKLNDSEGLTVEDLIRDISTLDIEDDSIVFIHSGLKSLGIVKGGAKTVVDALIEELVINRNITIAMPAFTISGTMESQLKSKVVFDVNKSDTVFTGIPLYFQNVEGVERSVHPTHSVTALGPKANWLTDSHHTCGSTFGEGSPFGKLLECKSYIMGLGTRLGTVTFYHALEDIEKDFPFRVYTKDSPIKTNCVTQSGQKVELFVSAHDGRISPNRIDKRNSMWLRDIYTKILESNSKLKWFKVGKAKTWLCPCDELYKTQKALTYNGLSIYSSEKDVANFILKVLNGEKNEQR